MDDHGPAMGRQEDIRIQIEKITPSVSSFPESYFACMRQVLGILAPLVRAVCAERLSHLCTTCDTRPEGPSGWRQKRTVPISSSCMACSIPTHTSPVRLQMFAELIRCPEVLVAHHKHLNDNEWIKVGPFDGAYRRVAYITSWDCSSKPLKRLVRTSADFHSCALSLQCISPCRCARSALPQKRMLVVSTRIAKHCGLGVLEMSFYWWYPTFDDDLCLSTAYDLLKIVETQHLQLTEDDSGTVIEAVLTTQPTIASVPVMGTIKMGTVVIRACSEPGFDGCVVSLLCFGKDQRLPTPLCIAWVWLLFPRLACADVLVI